MRIEYTNAKAQTLHDIFGTGLMDRGIDPKTGKVNTDPDKFWKKHGGLIGSTGLREINGRDCSIRSWRLSGWSLRWANGAETAIEAVSVVDSNNRLAQIYNFAAGDALTKVYNLTMKAVDNNRCTLVHEGEEYALVRNGSGYELLKIDEALELSPHLKDRTLIGTAAACLSAIMPRF